MEHIFKKVSVKNQNWVKRSNSSEAYLLQDATFIKHISVKRGNETSTARELDFVFFTNFR